MSDLEWRPMYNGVDHHITVSSQLPSKCSASTQPQLSTILGRWITLNKAME